MSQNSISTVISTIQSNFHHLINERCSYLKDEFEDFEYPNLTLHFESLISTIKENPTITTVKFGDKDEEEPATSVRISGLTHYFAVPEFYGGFTV